MNKKLKVIEGRRPELELSILNKVFTPEGLNTVDLKILEPKGMLTDLKVLTASSKTLHQPMRK